MDPGVVTTIIPVFNRPEMLQEAVASVIGQTYRPIEIIIVDDGSTDATAGIADQLARERTEIRVLHRPNGGPGAARESGRSAARGEFIQHLDSDDVLLPRKFELQVAGLRANADCGAAYGWTRFRHPDGHLDPGPWKGSGQSIETMFPAMLLSRCWDTPTPLYRASLLERAGPWLPLRIEEDWEYDARIASLGVRLYFVPDWVCEVRRHDAHISGHRNLSALRDRAAAHAAIYGHARRAGIRDDAPEMRHFARELFLLSRQCGAAGLSSESQMLFELSREASGTAGRRLQFRIYALLGRIAGWRTMGRLSEAVDRFRW